MSSFKVQYRVQCFSCGLAFDATAAAWCGCSNDPTLVCSQCKRCFCSSPSTYKRMFWIDAPISLL
jgi:hypothetical protein